MQHPSSSSAAPPLGKFLASTEKSTRDKAIKHLSTFLSSDPSQSSLSKADLAKLWKGIFYCFWMSDKPLVQQALAGELAELLLTISTTSTSLAFLRAFWECTVREWNGIDRLRIDKYYMLVRRFVNATFRLLLRSKWDEDACQEYNNILMSTEGPLCSSDTRVPTSLTYHLADIYLEELDKVLTNSPDLSLVPVPLRVILDPFITLAARTQNKTTYQRIQTALLERLFDALSNTHPDDDKHPRKRARSESDYQTLTLNACFEKSATEGPTEPSVLKKKLLRYLFEYAGQVETRDPNRRKMYRLCRGEVEDGEE
ncbi:hypothetical protein AMATHDRAFT_194545 [Amanita thiersii Skay4041]|uniref:Uncharacterized protein n=1 Tax=Amanita thiersii Skay4041 TaxID=703135 RepID=A0A2A9NK39_9AGAR|nr:hypothetical protein AMATHDRAFT_194545 [Amanita thiersii Skay4041]